MRKFLLDMRKDFLIMSNFSVVEILGKRNSLTIVTSKKITKMSSYALILSIYFLKMRIRNVVMNFAVYVFTFVDFSSLVQCHFSFRIAFGLSQLTATTA